MKLSIIVPCYNEKQTIDQILTELKKVELPIETEILVIDDDSNDGTRDKLKRWENSEFDIHYLDENVGKTRVIEYAKDHITGDLTLVQDADLEYAPKDIKSLVDLYLEKSRGENNNLAVYGSRNLGRKNYIYRSYYLGGVVLSKIFNFLYDEKLTDIATGYKLLDSETLKKIDLGDTRFGFCYEVSTYLAKNKYSIYESPIDYEPRSFADGKKIRFKDGLEAFLIITKNRIF